MSLGLAALTQKEGWVWFPRTEETKEYHGGGDR